MTGFIFENNISNINKNTDSNGIGISSIKNMIEIMGGKVYYRKK